MLKQAIRIRHHVLDVIMSSRPPNGMVKSSIENSGLLITRTLHRHKHQLRGLFQQTRLFTTVALRDQNEVRETTVHAGTVVVYVYAAGLRWWTR